MLADADGPRNNAAHPVGVIVPHAGYAYSGPTAACAYAWLAGRNFETVVIVSPSHQEYFRGVSVFPGEAYETPLGKVPIHGSLRDALMEDGSLVQCSVAGHGKEHAIEVQLPFLQVVLGEFSMIPLVMGDQNRETCFSLGKLLASTIAGREVLLVASTDLSHYHEAEEAEVLDTRGRQRIEAMDAELLMQDLDAGRTEACGGGPTVAVMAALSSLGVPSMQIVHHCNSGDVTGERRVVVGYCSAVAWR
jgi:AmmeMemoRadiSam system protein B